MSPIASFAVVALGTTFVFLTAVALWLRRKPGALAYWGKCLLWGEFFAATQEMINLVIVQRQFGNYLFSLIVFYLNFATICFVVYRLFERVFRTRVRADIACIIFAGIFGLQFDWFLWKDPPWSQPNLIAVVLSQGGIFVFYGMVCFMPRMYLRSGGNYATIRKHSLIYYFVVFILICYPVGIFGPPGLTYTLNLFGSIIFGWFFICYLIETHRIDSAAHLHDKSQEAIRISRRPK